MMMNDYQKFQAAIHLIILVVLMFIAIFLAYVLTKPIHIATDADYSLEENVHKIEADYTRLGAEVKRLKERMRIE